MFAIRQANLTDLNAILELAASIPEAPRWGRYIYESYLRPGPSVQVCFVLGFETTIAGFIAGTVVHDFCELDSIAVSENTRSLGAGSALLSALIAWARTQSASKMQLEVRAGNTTAINFYTRAGFHPDGVRPNYYRSPDEDAVLMSMSITSESNS